jgi:hypothetical protein
MTGRLSSILALPTASTAIGLRRLISEVGSMAVTNKSQPLHPSRARPIECTTRASIITALANRVSLKWDQK